METVQLQCGHCQKLIAIRVEHMGSQVKCPHCQQVVQTPPRPAPPSPAPTPAATLDLHQPESIFSGPESSDSLMDDMPMPKVQLPSANGTIDSAPSSHQTHPAPPPSGEADFSQFKKKPAFDKSLIPLLMLIFLVPYALTTTAFILYLLFVQAKPPHPLDYLRDPAPGKKEGGARQVWQPKTDLPLAEHQRTTLGKSIQVGDLLVTPQRVVLTEAGDLKLILRAKNVSANTKFEPTNDQFLRPTKGGSEPYAYLECKGGTVSNINAVFLAYYKNAAATGEPSGDAVLSPGEEVTIALTTDLKFQQKFIPKIAKAADESFTWRVRVRRGFVKVDGKDVSATAVIGVDFTNPEIEREKKS